MINVGLDNNILRSKYEKWGSESQVITLLMRERKIVMVRKAARRTSQVVV